MPPAVAMSPSVQQYSQVHAKLRKAVFSVCLMPSAVVAP
jgi:hypothetical protein